MNASRIGNLEPCWPSGSEAKTTMKIQSVKELPMSPLPFTQAHSTNAATASNVSPLHPSGSTTMKVCPVSVRVHWSESERFEENQQYDFNDFERFALLAAVAHPLGGYDKTKVTVEFNNGQSHSCRLDLGCGSNDLGFADHCFKMLEASLSDSYSWYAQSQEGQELITRLKTYQLNRQFVSFARLRSKDIVRVAKEYEEAEQKKEAERVIAAREDKAQIESEFRAGLVVPEWAKSVIVARYTEYDEVNSDPYGDYYRYKTVRTIVLAWSKHDRRIFSELRKACLNHPDTAFLADKAQSAEHRENYSMGKGLYLTNSEYISSGWEVQKITFWGEDKASYVPVGELCESVQ
jgi:hypothetical protein